MRIVKQDHEEEQSSQEDEEESQVDEEDVNKVVLNINIDI